MYRFQVLKDDRARKTKVVIDKLYIIEEYNGERREWEPLQGIAFATQYSAQTHLHSIRLGPTTNRQLRVATVEPISEIVESINVYITTNI